MGTKTVKEPTPQQLAQWQTEITELALYIDNEASLYPQKQAIIANMKRKLETGTYDQVKAVTGWMHWVAAGASKYAKEFKVELIRTFPVMVRWAVARDVAKREYDNLKAGEYGELKKPAPKVAKASKRPVKKASKR